MRWCFGGSHREGRGGGGVGPMPAKGGQERKRNARKDRAKKGKMTKHSFVLTGGKRPTKKIGRNQPPREPSRLSSKAWLTSRKGNIS